MRERLLEDETLDDYSHREIALLLDRNRRDMIARITPESVESFAMLETQYDMANELERILCLEEGVAAPERGKRIADNLHNWLDEILIKSASGRGWRATQIENVQKSARSESVLEDDDIEATGRGLKHG